MDAKITALAERMSSERLDKMRASGYSYPGYEDNAKATVIPGRKYTKIDIGGSGKLMIDEAGHIFGIKGYGQVNKSRQYGTLDTIESFYWGDYYPRRKEVKR